MILKFGQELQLINGGISGSFYSDDFSIRQSTQDCFQCIMPTLEQCSNFSLDKIRQLVHLILRGTNFKEKCGRYR